MTGGEGFKARERVSVRLGLDALHVLVAEAEMVADLVDHHMAHDVEERQAGHLPIGKQRPAVEEDHVVDAADNMDAVLRQRNTAIEAE